MLEVGVGRSKYFCEKVGEKGEGGNPQKNPPWRVANARSVWLCEQFENEKY